MDNILGGTSMLTLVIYVLLALLGLASLVAGVICLIFYFKTRKTLLLIVGLLLTFLVPGLFICIAVILWLPNAFVVYAPPPPGSVP